MKSILFIEEMFNQVISGNKTMTRRLSHLEEVNLNPDLYDFSFMERCVRKSDNKITSTYAHFIHNKSKAIGVKARLNVGEKLYLKEPYCFSRGAVLYKFDNFHWQKDICDWKNKLFMAEIYARYFIEITEVRCERLQNISPKDAIDEGIQELLQSGSQLAMNGKLFRDYSKKPELFNDGLKPKKSFKTLWESINKKGSWKKNPYVFVYKFKLTSNERDYN